MAPEIVVAQYILGMLIVALIIGAVGWFLLSPSVGVIAGVMVLFGGIYLRWGNK
jgi:hypothetical protein